MSAAFPPLPQGTTTNCGCPWALIKRGGVQPGKRPSTRLAFITSASSRDGGRTLIIRAIMPKPRGGWTTPRDVAERDVLRQWRNTPDASAVRKARAAVPVEAI